MCCSRMLRSIAEPYTRAARSCDKQHVSKHLSEVPCGEWPLTENHWFRLDVVVSVAKSCPTLLRPSGL